MSVISKWAYVDSPVDTDDWHIIIIVIICDTLKKGGPVIGSVSLGHKLLEANNGGCTFITFIFIVFFFNNFSDGPSGEFLPIHGVI